MPVPEEAAAATVQDVTSKQSNTQKTAAATSCLFLYHTYLHRRNP